MKNKGFATIVIFGIILGALVVVGGAYYLGTKKEVKNEEININSEEKLEKNDLSDELNMKKQESFQEINKEENNKQVENLTLNNEIEITLYFGNKIFNPEMLDCGLVYPVKRKIFKTEAIAKATLEELIKGPTKEEEKLGYYGAVPVGTKINSINIKNGLLSIDFSKEIENNFASCSGLFRLSSINKTLKQFPSVKDIQFAVDGNWNSDEILQP
jgi:spore germination protein GerM